MAYENYEIALIQSFGEDLKEGRVRLDNIDTQSNNARTKYDRYIKRILEIKPRTYLAKDFDNLGKKYVFEKAFSIIIMIFGDKAIEEALDFFRHLVESHAEEALDGISLTVVDKRDGSEMKMVEVPDFETSSNIVTIVHEFAHYYLNKIGVDYNKKRYYEEVMSILCEKIAGQVVELHTCERDFYNKVTEQRLDSIAWHYGSNLPAMHGILDQHTLLKRQARTDLFAGIQLSSLEHGMPFLKTAQGISALKGYYQNMADGYGIGFLYSESLLARFLDDDKTFRLQLSRLTDQSQTFQQLLDYYGINARNNEVYDRVNTRLEEIKQFKKR